jgi:hypothetical protein
MGDCLTFRIPFVEWTIVPCKELNGPRDGPDHHHPLRCRVPYLTHVNLGGLALTNASTPS